MTGLARLTGLAAVLAAALFVVLAVITERHLKVQGLDIFDARFLGYGAEEARAYLNALEASGRVALYLGWFRWLDTVFPLLLTVTFVGAIWVNTGGRGMILRLALVIPPLVYLWSDLQENARVAGMLMAGKAVTDAEIALSSSMTQVKWACVAVSIFTVLATWGVAFRTKRGMA